MTDFIHEHPKEEPDPNQHENQTKPEQEETLDESTGQKRVYGYILILFIVAFSLLLWSFLMNQRSTDQVLSELRGSNGALQTTLDRNVELEKQMDELQSQNEDLKVQIEELEKQINTEKQEKLQLHEESEQINKLAKFYSDVAQLEYAYEHNDTERCRKLIENGLYASYKDREGFSENDTEENRPMTRAYFEEILKAIGYEGPEEN